MTGGVSLELDGWIVAVAGRSGVVTRPRLAPFGSCEKTQRKREMR